MASSILQKTVSASHLASNLAAGSFLRENLFSDPPQAKGQISASWSGRSSPKGLSWRHQAVEREAKRLWRVRAEATSDTGTKVEAAAAAAGSGKSELLAAVGKAVSKKDSVALRSALGELKEAGQAAKWDSLSNITRRQVFVRELSMMGIKNPEELAVPSTRNDLSFLVGVTGVCSLLAVMAGVVLPGDWGFFVPYLLGGVVLVVLAVGSTAPGLLEVAINSASLVFPDQQDRVLRHEAAHFLVAYLLGLPVVGYSLELNREHTNLVDAALQQRILTSLLDTSELERLAVVAMAGIAAEGLAFDKVIGQQADLLSLQRLINRTKPKLGNSEQQNLTRWAVLFAASLLKNNSVQYEALQSAMAKKACVEECISAIESA